MNKIETYYVIKVQYQYYTWKQYKVAGKFEDAVQYAREQYLIFISKKAGDISYDQLTVIGVELIELNQPITILENTK